jgi:hypothetical protein
MHEAACRLTRVARARLRQRAHKQRVACLALQAACRLWIALRRVRHRRALLEASVKTLPQAVEELEEIGGDDRGDWRRSGAFEQLEEMIERLRESDTDGMAMTSLIGALHARITAHYL